MTGGTGAGATWALEVGLGLAAGSSEVVCAHGLRLEGRSTGGEWNVPLIPRMPAPWGAVWQTGARTET